MKHVRRQSIRTLTALVVTLVLLLTASIAMATDEETVGRIQVNNLPTGTHPTDQFPSGPWTGGLGTGNPWTGGLGTGNPWTGNPWTGGPGTGGIPTGNFPNWGQNGDHDGWPWGNNDGPCDHEQYPERDHHSRREKITNDTVTVDPVIVVEEVPLVVPKTGSVDHTSMAIGILLMLVSAAGIAFSNRARVSAK